MAPTKRKNDEKSDTVSENLKSTRATRSSTRLASQGVAKVVVEAAPKTKKAKVSSKEKPDAKAKPFSKKKPEPKAKITEEEEEAEVADPPANGVNGSKTIVIEHCKQCTQFKIRAVKVKAGMETAVSGINVLVNPEKPRRGCFEVREEGGKIFISLLDMKRPFAPMKALDMDVVISNIVDQIK